MRSAANATHRNLPRRRALALLLVFAGIASLAAAGVSGPDFSKEFTPDTIGPYSTSMLVFTIDNKLTGLVAEDLAFSDTLPGGMTLATPAFVSNDCGGTVSAPDGGSTVSLTDGAVGIDGICTVVVNVTAGLVEGDETYMNVSGPLSSSQGTGDTAADDLMVVTTLPGFFKTFAPSTVAFGGRSTLTLTIDNFFNASSVPNLDFTDILPPGMVVADPANASTDCGTATIPPTLTANPGSDTIILDANGIASFPAVGAGATCTVTVDVIGGSAGLLGNVSGNLLADFVEAGKAAAVLEVTGVEDLLELRKEFIDDPVAPGGTVTLEFTVTNKSRDDAATGITFDDTIDPMGSLTGVTVTLPPDPDPPCGAGSGMAFMGGVLTLTGGTLPSEGSCTFTVELNVPGTATPGSYPNTTTAVSGDVGGSPETGNSAGDLLFVVPFPVLTKEFTDDPVAAGGTVTLEFTIFNPASSAATDIEFVDELTDNIGSGAMTVGNGFLPFPVSVTLPPVPDPPCGAGSSLALVFIDTDRQGLELTGGMLAATDGVLGGSDTCTFSVTIDIPVGFPGGTYLNTTEPISATVSGGTVVGPEASDSAVIAGAPELTKEFTDDPVLPSGGTVTLEFGLFYDADEGSPDAIAIAFTDDLKTVLPGMPDLTAASVDTNTCTGAMVDITTDPTVIAVTGGTLTAGESCLISLTLTVPMGAPVGFHTNTTSDVTSTTGGVMATGNPASDDLLVTPLEFTKEFTDDPAIPGEMVTLLFTITNNGISSTDDATSIAFSDSLSSILPGTPDVTSTGPPSTNTCGGTESGISTFLFYTGGSLAFGSSCTIEYDLLVPAGAADGDYVNTTSSLTATIDGSGVTIDPAVDVLSIDSELLALTKEFTDDPVLPDSPVTLELVLTNLSATDTVTDVAFDDDLTATLADLEASSVDFDDCGGTVDISTPTLIDVTGVTLLPSASCTIRLTLDVPPAPLAGSVFPNTTSSLTGKVGTLDVVGAAASDDLQVQLVTFSKSFTDDPTTATGTATLEFTITNFDSSAGVTGLAFSDDLDAVISGLEATVLPATPCGAGSVAAGTSFFTLTGGSLAAAGSPGDSCTFAVTVTVPVTATAGSFLNTTSDLFVEGLTVADPATAFLDIEPAPLFSKEFLPDTVGVDEVSTLTFTIDNTASMLAASALDFADTFPLPLVVATPAGASTTCTGGTLTAVAGTDTISYTGGEVAAGATCEVSVDVTSDTADLYINTSGDLTSSSGNSGPASDTLTVVETDADLELVKRDVFEPVMSGRYQIYELTVTNLGPATSETVVLEDVLPVGTTLVVAEPTSVCGEAGGMVTCAVGDLAVGESFTATMMVYVELTEMPVALDNLATVSSTTMDPVPGNNDVMESTEVIPHTGLAMLDDVDVSGFPEVAVPLPGSIEVLVKDADTLAALHQTEAFPSGWALAGFEKKPGVGGATDDVAVMAVEAGTDAAEVRVISGLDGSLQSTSVVPAGFLPVTMKVIPDDGTMRSLIAVGTVSLTGGRGRVFFFDCSDGSLVSEFPLHPGAWPIDLAAVSSFAGDSLVEIGVLWVKTNSGGKRLQIKEISGTTVGTQNLPIEMSPLALDGVADCCGGVSDELAALGWDRVADKVRLRVVEADGGAGISDGVFASMGQPMDVKSLGHFGGSSADELVSLFRNPALRAAVQVRDAMTFGSLLVARYGKPAVGSSVPLSMDVSPSAWDTVVDEVSVYWFDTATGDMFVTVSDPGGTFVLDVPIP